MPPTVIEEMEEMFLRLGSSQTVGMKLVDDQGSSWTPASLSDKDIASICNVTIRPGGLVSGKTPDSGNQISSLAAKNVKLSVFMFNIMEHCSKHDEIRCVNSTSTLQYINGSWSRRKWMRLRCPKLIRTIRQKLWRT